MRPLAKGPIVFYEVILFGNLVDNKEFCKSFSLNPGYPEYPC